MLVWNKRNQTKQTKNDRETEGQNNQHALDPIHIPFFSAWGPWVLMNVICFERMGPSLSQSNPHLFRTTSDEASSTASGGSNPELQFGLGSIWGFLSSQRPWISGRNNAVRGLTGWLHPFTSLWSTMMVGSLLGKQGHWSLAAICELGETRKFSISF